MPIEATVLAVVPFTQSIVPLLEEAQESYAAVKPGTPVLAELFHMRTSDSSRRLAAMLGVELGDAATYLIRPQAIANLTDKSLAMRELRELCDYAGEHGHAERFSELAKIPGAQLFFRTN